MIVVRAGLTAAAMTAAYGALLFLFAGTARWPAAWIYLAVMTVIMTEATVILRRQPDLLAERRKPPADAKRWDKPLVALFGVAGPLALVVVCGLDRRWHWSPDLAWPWRGAGLLVVAGAGAITNWALSVNRFFSALVRIQHDRGHRVVDAGPYRFVRHPAYIGSIVQMPGAALLLGSIWGIGVGACVGAVLVLRTALEDRTLRAELDGYGAYSARVGYRLVPGIW